MVDELDRCSPDYAVEVLQLLEHVFHTEHVVFVVAVNQSELIHSIRSFYGEGFNAEGYLERFFDDILPLPSSRRSQYIETSLGSLEHVDTLAAAMFLEASGLSLREIDKSVHHLKSVLGASYGPTYALVDLWIARTLAPVEYRQFLSGEIPDKTLADAVFGKGNCGTIRIEGRRSEIGRAGQWEATLIAASCVLPRGSASPYFEDPAAKSELYRHHDRVGAKGVSDKGVPASYSKDVMQTASSLSDRLLSGQDVGGIAVAASLLERESQVQ